LVQHNPGRSTTPWSTTPSCRCCRVQHLPQRATTHKFFCFSPGDYYQWGDRGGGRSTGVDPSHGWKCRPSYGRVHVPGRALQGAVPQQEELWDCYCEVGPGRTIGTRYCEGLSQGQKENSLPQRPAWSARSRTTTYSRSGWGRRSETHKIRVCKLNLLVAGKVPDERPRSRYTDRELLYKGWVYDKVKGEHFCESVAIVPPCFDIMESVTGK